MPHGISIVSRSGSTRRLNVERLMPRASAAWVRVYVSRSTRFVSRMTTDGSGADGPGGAGR